MAGTVWSKWFWSDWDTDPALKLCGFAAQGLWMRLLCIAAAHDPIGYVSVAGRPLDSTAIARMTGGTEPEVDALLSELERNGVFSRDGKGRIYSRRMIRDAKKAATARKNGKKGGNPSLGKQKDNPASDKGGDKGGVKPQSPEAISHKPDNRGVESPSTSDGPDDDATWDVIRFADEVCRVAGVRNIDPGKIISNTKAVREWVEAGADPPMIVSAVQRGRGTAKNGIYSLLYFDARVRQAIADRDHPNDQPRDDFSTIRDPLLRRYLERGGTLEI